MLLHCFLRGEPFVCPFSVVLSDWTGVLCGIGSAATPCLLFVVHCSRVRPDGALQALIFLKMRKAIASFQHQCVQFVTLHKILWVFTIFCPSTTSIMAKHKKTDEVVILITGY